MSRTDPQVNFRMPQELRDKLEAASKANKRTLTAEIVARLQQSFVAESEFHAGPGLFGSPGQLEPGSYQKALAEALRNDFAEMAKKVINESLDTKLADIARSIEDLSLTAAQKDGLKALEETSIPNAFPPKK